MLRIQRTTIILFLAMIVSLLPTLRTQAQATKESPLNKYPILITWSDNAVNWRDHVGDRFILVCLPDDSVGSLWGDGIYTDDSSICTAAVHAGLITHEEGGTVILKVVEGQDSYKGTTRNGVTSNDYGKWDGSYRFLNGVKGYYAVTGLTWASTAAGLHTLDKVRINFICPPEGDTSGSVWGTDIYTNDSSICTAAVHAGLFKVSTGGSGTLEGAPGQESYKGSTRNGITTSDYGAWEASFRFITDKATESLDGTWIGDFGALILDTNNADSCGSYATHDGDGKPFKGTLANCTASENGTVLEGDWQDPTAKGTFKLTLNEDGSTFSGTYKDGGSGEWNGFRTTSAKR